MRVFLAINREIAARVPSGGVAEGAVENQRQLAAFVTVCWYAPDRSFQDGILRVEFRAPFTTQPPDPIVPFWVAGTQACGPKFAGRLAQT